MSDRRIIAEGELWQFAEARNFSVAVNGSNRWECKEYKLSPKIGKIN